MNKKISLFILLPLTFYAFIVPLFLSEISAALPINQSPNLIHLFGTDDLGRDLFVRCAKALQISIGIAVVVSMIDGVFGFLIGCLSAIFRGPLDFCILRVCEVLQAIPSMLIVILMMLYLNDGVFSLLIALSCLGWINIARMVRYHVLQLKQKEYILTAKLMGASTLYLMRTHYFSQIRIPLISAMSTRMMQAIFIESFLSFLGIGVRYPTVSCGSLISDAIVALNSQPWRLLIPSVLLILLLFGLNIFTETFEERRAIAPT